MELNYVSNGNFGEVIITVPEKDDVEKVTNALDLISELLCFPLDRVVDEDANEIYVYVEDYYEFLTLSKKLLDHCDAA